MKKLPMIFFKFFGAHLVVGTKYFRMYGIYGKMYRKIMNITKKKILPIQPELSVLRSFFKRSDRHRSRRSRVVE